MWNVNFIIILSFLLTGCLPVVFTAAAGSTVAIAKDRTINETIDDIKLATKIKTSFVKNNFRDLYSKISIDVSQGRVLLTGTVNKEEDQLKAIELIWEEEGVQEVINELAIDQNSDYFSFNQYTQDTFITSQIKAKTVGYHNIKWVNYSIITFNKVVYVFGIARSQEELEQVTSIAAQVKGVRKVICHAKII